MNESEFHDRVRSADDVDVDIDQPEAIAEATLETLGEALSSGQADDLATHLPDQYADALVEGGERTDDGEGGTGGDGAASLSREAFLERVGDRHDGDADDLRRRTTAVLDALQESIPREEQRAVRSQLPDDVEALFTGSEGAR